MSQHVLNNGPCRKEAENRRITRAKSSAVLGGTWCGTRVTGGLGLCTEGITLSPLLSVFKKPKLSKKQLCFIPVTNSIIDTPKKLNLDFFPKQLNN